MANINDNKDGTKGFNTHKVVGVEVSREDQLPSMLTPPQNMDRNYLVLAKNNGSNQNVAIPCWRCNHQF